MSPPIKCEVILDKPSSIYFAGETVKGKVIVSLKKATRIAEMNLHLVGKARFGQKSFEFFRETKTVELNSILPSGIEKFPITWTLPHDLISSCAWKSGCTNYYFVAEIQDCMSAPSGTPNSPQFFVERIEASALLEVQNPLDLNQLPQEYHITKGYNASYFQHQNHTHLGRNLPQENNKTGTGNENEGQSPPMIAVDFVINRQALVPGQFLRFDCSVKYETPESNKIKKIPGVRVTLDQEESFYTGGSVNTSTTKIWQKTGPLIRSNDIITWDERIKIPNHCQSTPMDCYGCISVQYFLNVSTSLWGAAYKPQFKIPIIVGQIPLEESTINTGPMVQKNSRPSITAVLDDNQHALLNTDFPEDKEDARPETPPPSYEDAIVKLNFNKVVKKLEQRLEIEKGSPPPYFSNLLGVFS